MKKKILIVDDNRLLRKFLSTHLGKEGHYVQTAEDGFAALELLSTFTPDIMFIDLFMPKIDGERLCQIIRSRETLAGCHIVILSAGIAETGKNYIEIGADACIAKGSFSSMAKNVLTAIQDADTPAKEQSHKPIIGLDAVYSRQLTKELISKNRHLETILESMTEGFLEVFSERVVFANEAAVDMLSTSMEGLLYAFPPDLFSGRARKYIETLISVEGPPASNQDDTFDVNDRKITIRSYPVEGESDTSIIILSDVTEQKKLEEKLQQAKKMEAIGTLAGGVAHDFNNLLMGIQGNISLMLLNKEEDALHFDEIKSIERCVESAAKLTQQLLGFARGGKYVIKATSLNDLIEKLTRMFQRTHKNIVFHEIYQPGLWAVEVDQGQIEQVMLNLYLNACQAVHDKGKLTVKTENVFLDLKTARSLDLKPGKFVNISVIDDGIGMDSQVRLRIFEPFFTTKDVGKGSGMGLASAFGIIRNHKGIIDCQSKKGKGSTFSIYLPATDFSVMEDSEENLVLLKGSETILLVDDESLILNVGRRLLKELGYRVFIARNGKSALKILAACHADIDLVILDIVMPEMDGEEVYARMKQIEPELHVLLASGYSIDWQARKLIEAGCHGFIQKPFKFNELSLQIRKILENSQGASSS
jgi:signal transduction histidine kinase/DNA-binding LytR/AlgR family response regulator